MAWFKARPIQAGAMSATAWVAMACLCGVQRQADAADLYQINLSVPTGAGTATGQAGFNSLNGVVNALKGTNLNQIVGAYTDVSPATANINFRGLPVRAVFAANSTRLDFQIPGINLARSFQGATRAASAQQLLDYLQRQGSDVSTALARRSLVDPVAGNPTSLTSRMIGRDFLGATGIGGFSSDNAASAGAAAEAVPNAVTVGGEFSHASAGGYDISTVTLPINYTAFFADPRYSLTLDLPLTYSDVQGAAGAQASFGAGFRFPVLENWYLTVSARAGVAGSVDLASGGIAYSGSVTSLYNLYFGDYKVLIGNSVGVIKTDSLSVGSVSVGPKLTNVPLINGIGVEGSLPWTLFDRPTSWETYVVDTYFAGDRLAIQHYDELGVTFGTRRRPGDQSWSVARVGLAYTVGNSFNMITLRGSYRF